MPQICHDACVPLHGIYEATFTQTGRYDNPYVDLSATARLTEPGGRAERLLPLFWDGGDTWRLRFSPDREGVWEWTIDSPDPGLGDVTGRFEVSPSQNRGGLQPMDGHPYHFQRQNGDPVWFMGDTAWALYTDSRENGHDRDSVHRYIDTRAAQGFNVIHSMLISEAGWGNRGGDAFSDFATERIDPAYWQEVDERLAHLNARGITGGLVLSWGDKGRNPNNWRTFPSQEARLRYARYVAARYGAHDAYFVVAGEWDADTRRDTGLTDDAIRDQYREIGRTICEVDPQGRMVAIHPMVSPTSREFAKESWMSFGDYQQVYRKLHGEILTSRHFDKPVVNSEYAYYLRDRDADGVVDKENSHDLDATRHATWDIAMAGGYLITGFGTTYFGGHRNPGPFEVDAPQDDEWESQVQHAKVLFESLAWWRLEPRDDLIGTPVDRTGDRGVSLPGRKHPLVAPPEVAYWALAEEGCCYIAYVRGISGPVYLKVRGDVAYRVRQFDPRTGSYTALASPVVQGRIEYIPPDPQDWVIVLTSANVSGA